MKPILLSIVILVLSSCNSSENLEFLKSTIAETDSVVVFYPESQESIQIVGNELKSFQKIVTQGVKPEFQKKMKADRRIDVYFKSRKTGSLVISINNEGGFVNFFSEERSFGYALPYGIGRFIEEFRSQEDTAANNN